MSLATIQDLLSSDEEGKEKGAAYATLLHTLFEEHLCEPEDNSHRLPGIHASELSGCKRKIVYSLLQTERRDHVPLFWKKKFKLGHAMHDMLQGEFYKMARKFEYKVTGGTHVSFHSELPIAPKYQPLAARWDIQSHLDGLFTIREHVLGPAVCRILLEIKSMNPDEFADLSAPKPEHIEQSHVYMAVYDVPLTWVLYFNKANENYTPPEANFLVKFDPHIWQGLEERIAWVEEQAALGQLPEREEGITCRFCPFSWTCTPPSLQPKPQLHTAAKRIRT